MINCKGCSFWEEVRATWISQLNGMYAIAIWNPKDKQLLLARDPMGIKPLVYYVGNKTIAFASEMKALLEMNFERKLDKVSAFTYFKLNYIPAPHTILEKHFKLLPGHFAIISFEQESLKFEIRNCLPKVFLFFQLLFEWEYSTRLNTSQQ